MNVARFDSPRRGVFLCNPVGRDLDRAPSQASAQLSQRNTTTTRAPDVGLGAEVFGGLEGKLNDSGTTFAPESPADADLGEQAIIQPVTEL